MSEIELTGNRDLSYSVWHRTASTARYIGLENAQLLSMIDLDVILYVECHGKQPIALLEVAKDYGQYKASTITKNLAARCNGHMPALVALYTNSIKPNPADPKYLDIEKVRFKRIWPQGTYWDDWITVTAKEWAEILLGIRHNGYNSLSDLILKP